VRDLERDGLGDLGIWLLYCCSSSSLMKEEKEGGMMDSPHLS